MKFFTRKAPADRVGTVGANTPGAHMTADAPAAMRGIEARGEFDGVPTAPSLPLSGRSFRATDQRMNASATGDVSLSAPREAAAAEHLHRGAPDARRTYRQPRGFASAPQDRYLPATPAERTNARVDVTITPEAPPSRPRAGYTGADPTRVSRFQIVTLIRRFDQGIAQHPGPVEKIPQASPTAARPPLRGRMTDGRPNAGGTEGTYTNPIGGHRNTVRQQPKSWDASLTTPERSAAPSARARGWRL